VHLAKASVAIEELAMTQQQRSRNAWTKWRRLISEQARSGQSVAAFCRERDLCAPHFFWWKRRLRASTATILASLTSVVGATKSIRNSAYESPAAAA